MKRRDALLTLLFAPYMQKLDTTTNAGSLSFTKPDEPRDFTWQMSNIWNFIIERGGKRITISADEVWAALQP